MILHIQYFYVYLIDVYLIVFIYFTTKDIVWNNMF